jgi:hypothetical protein
VREGFDLADLRRLWPRHTAVRRMCARKVPKVGENRARAAGQNGTRAIRQACYTATQIFLRPRCGYASANEEGLPPGMARAGGERRANHSSMLRSPGGGGVVAHYDVVNGGVREASDRWISQDHRRTLTRQVNGDAHKDDSSMTGDNTRSMHACCTFSKRFGVRSNADD